MNILQDGSIRIWDTILCKTLITLSGHLQSVTCVQWGGEGLIYSASQDRTIKVWRDEDVRTYSMISKKKRYCSNEKSVDTD